MAQLPQATPQVKKNILMIRGLLAVILFAFAFLYVQAHPETKNLAILYCLALAATFLPFYFFAEEKFEQVHFQYGVFSMDFLFLLGGLYLFDHFETNLLIITFLTFFISAISQSIGRSIVVAIAVIGMYLYLNYYKSDVFNYTDPFLLLSCALLFVVAIHSGYMAYRTVQEEKEIAELAKKAALLTEKVRQGDQAALDYAATLKNVLDSLPIGAMAVSVEGNIIFVNARVGKILDVNPKSLTNLLLQADKDTPLLKIGETMAKALKDRKELKREYIDMDWKGHKKRFRLDSSQGVSPTGKAWGTLFLFQEASIPQPTDTSSNSQGINAG
ncbi:MAG TPA: PAS domain-containing protein [bacterium]|nr:PAS domain-containing protein [bacterium]